MMGSEEVENVKSLHRTDGQTNAAHFTIRKAQLVQVSAARHVHQVRSKLKFEIQITLVCVASLLSTQH
jgi:hypothetical protein